MNCSLSIFQAPFSPELLAPIPHPGFEGNLTMILPATRSCPLMTGVALHRPIHQTAGCLNRLQMQGHCWLSGTLLRTNGGKCLRPPRREPFSRSHGPQPHSRFLGAGSTQATLESRSTFTWPPLTCLIGFNRNDFPSPTGVWDSVYKVCHILWIPSLEALAAPTAPPPFLLLPSWPEQPGCGCIRGKGRP